jgi:hypothetical protein
MKLVPHRRSLVVFSSSADPADRADASPCKRLASAAQIRRFIRIGVLLSVIVVRSRWRPLLAGLALTVLGVIERQGAGGIAVIPGLVLLWQALLIPADTGADHERRSRLRRELAAYSTPARRCDLEATLDRYPDGVTYELRDILASQGVASHNHGIPGARSYRG